jgi:pimeloyl-ACP methyl ester carboxylesterase
MARRDMARAEQGPDDQHGGVGTHQGAGNRLTWKCVSVQGRESRYGEAGAGPTVLFLHGWGLDHKVYKRALARLVAAGVHVLAPALPGFGGTPALPRATTDLEGYAAWAGEFLRCVGVGEPVLAMGHSFGGGVAIKLAHDHPDQVRALVLVNSIGGSTWSHRGPRRRAMSDRPLWDWGIHFPADVLPTRQTRRVVPVIVAEALPSLLRDPRAFWDAAGLARRADLGSELVELRRRRLPVVVLWGRADRLITQDSFEDLCEALGRPQVVTVPGAHSWLIADPDAFGEVMTNVVDIVRLAGGDAGPVSRSPDTARSRSVEGG